MNSTSPYIEDFDLSRLWARALAAAYKKPNNEVVPLLLALVPGPGGSFIKESPADSPIRQSADLLLGSLGKQSIETVANTIFPTNLWNPSLPRKVLFDRYLRTYSRIRSSKPRNKNKNKHGTYFGRMIRWESSPSGGPETLNQLDFILDSFLSQKGSPRRSKLQVSIFDPALDHNRAAQRGFPCLQHIVFTKLSRTHMSISAFYANQYLVERGYGNYLGLLRLGQFIAHELGLELVRLNVFASIANAEKSKRALQGVIDLLKER